MATSAIDGLYYEFHVPLGLKSIIEKLISDQPSSRNTPTSATGSGDREWYSQPRPGTDNTTEVITAHFKLPLSVSEISFDILRVPCSAEAWYLDRMNNWRQLLDRQRSPVSIPVQASGANSWYTYSSSVYPVVAQAVQIRIKRTADAQYGSNSYVVGLRNTLIRRNVYDRAAGKMPFEEEQDALGNVISKYVEDWDATQAIDNKPFTFWKSAPLPDPQAVCSLYLDTRTPQGAPQYMDGLFLDPVYGSQSLNIYYSNDDEPGSPRLSPITLKPEATDGTNQNAINDLNTDWRSGLGRWDSSTSPSGSSRYRFPAKWGPMSRQDIWIGIEWIPDFSAGSAPPSNPMLLEVTPTTQVTGQFAPSVYYDCGDGTIVLRFFDGTTTKTYATALSPLLTKGQAVRIVVGWSYGPDKVYISVQNRQGAQLGFLESAVPSTSPTYVALPPYVTMDGKVGFSSARGMFTSHVIKREKYTDNAPAFLSNPSMYVDPDPVLANPDGSIPSTSLDNALYAVDWTLQEHGTGGAHESFYTKKTWQPIFADYITKRGKLFFPYAIAAKYLKLEFTRLTEESYPIYDAGISVTYQVFPVEVSQTQTQNNPGLLGAVSGLLTVGAQTLVGGFGTVNWLNPQTVATAINSVFGPVVNPVTVQASPGFVTGSIPGTAQSPIFDTTRTEMSSPYIYRRGMLDPAALAASHIYYSGFTTWSQTLSNANELFGGAINNSFTPLRSYITNPTAGPVQGNDFWIFPGATLKMPAAVMNGLTALTETIVGRAPTSENRMRFTTNSVHRYETRTVKRDAAVAYFAGVREAHPILTSYIDATDPTVFSFTNYTAQQNWDLTNTRLVESKVTYENDLTKAEIALLQLELEETVANSPTNQALINATQAAILTEQNKINPSQSTLAALQATLDAELLTVTVYNSGLAALRDEIAGLENKLKDSLATRKMIAAPLTTAGKLYSIEGADFDNGIDNWTARLGAWTWDTDVVGGRYYPGAAKVIATNPGTKKELVSTKVGTYPESTLTAGDTLTFKAYTRWSGLTVVNNQPGIQLGLTTYKDGAVVSDSIVLSQISYSNWAANAASSSSANNYVLLTNTTPWVVPEDVDEVRVRLVMTQYVTAGSVWFDSINISSGADTTASVYQSFTTVSDFAKLRCTFEDSGPVRSNSMWLRSDYPEAFVRKIPNATSSTTYATYALALTGAATGGTYTLSYNGNDTEKLSPTAGASIIQSALAALPGIGTVTVTGTGKQFTIVINSITSTLTVSSAALLGGAANIDSTELTYYTSWISLDLLNPDGTRKVGGATWSDSLAAWGDTKTAWGSPESLVKIIKDERRSFNGQRVLRFSREKGAGEAGIRIRQWDNLVPNALYRLCARWYKPFDNNNIIKIRLRRASDGVVAYEEQISKPAVGYWYEFATTFQPLGSSTDQVYNLELVTSGSDKDELYLSDVWTEVSHVRYIVTLNGIAYDVTDLRYADTPIVSTAIGVHSFSVEARIYSPRASINWCRIEPLYNYERNPTAIGGS